MSRFFWFVTGIALGFVGAHYANRTEPGQRFLGRIDRGAREFGEAVARGYRSREAEFSHTLNEVEQSLSEAQQR